VITILFYPEALKANPLSRVYRILKGREDIVFHNNPLKLYDLHIFWSYTKHSIVPDELTLTDKDVINRGCWNVEKEKVNNVFNDIRIDPTKHKGFCVEKSNRQGDHGNHSIINCPTEKKEGYIYQKYIEDKEGNLFIKYRVYYADGIRYILKSYKPTPFGSECTKHILISKQDMFKTLKHEYKFILNCKNFGFDFGEIDVVMDNGEPIIVDVNNCVGGGFVWGLTGTKIHKRIDKSFIAFIKNRYDRASKI